MRIKTYKTPIIKIIIIQRDMDIQAIYIGDQIATLRKTEELLERDPEAAREYVRKKTRERDCALKCCIICFLVFLIIYIGLDFYFGSS